MSDFFPDNQPEPPPREPERPQAWAPEAWAPEPEALRAAPPRSRKRGWRLGGGWKALILLVVILATESFGLSSAASAWAKPPQHSMSANAAYRFMAVPPGYPFEQT